jgi:ubiquinone/menaquinone biosynthesis C-methylase UbiE
MTIETPEEFYSQNPEKYDEKYGALDGNERLEKLHEIFISELRGERILDAGCGTGRDTDYLARKGFDPIGIDIASGAIELAKKTKKGKYLVMDMRELEFEENSFDGVCCVASIFFMPKSEIESTLESFAEILKEKGVLHVSFKIGNGSRIKEKRGGKIREYHFTEEEITTMIESSNFKIIHEDQTENSEGTEFRNFIATQNKFDTYLEGDNI